MSKKYVIAVSGGVDSVVLLHMLTRLPGVELVVAHFDHGIRDDSSSDALFVANLARKYDLPFESKREELGKGASEDQARTRRYEFLRNVAQKHKAKIVTAHHADDAVETVAINLTRGTGWRGLAVLDSEIIRPLLDMSKHDILDYAKKHQLDWREDSTNASDDYLRNRIRQKTHIIEDDKKRQILALRNHQLGLKKQINEEVIRLVGEGPDYNRHFFIQADPKTALECLRYITQARLTRPQLGRVLIAIKTAKPGATYEAGDAVEFRFTSRNFTVKLVK